MFDLFLLCLVDYKKVIQLINQVFNFWFFNRYIKKRKFSKIINIWQNCNFYTLQMLNLDNIVNNKIEEHNENWPYIADHPYRILIIGGSGSGKTNTLI